MLPKLDDTIVAIATPVGQGGIGIIRLSGKKAVSIGDKIFKNKKNTKPSQFESHRVYFGSIVKKNKSSEEVVDEVLLTVMRAPKSYTAEDVAEISCHGGVMPMRAILKICLEHGARLAEPGEFTKRAFLNGRMDLAQAEAVLDVINAKTEGFLKASVNQLKGELTLCLEEIREALMSAYTHLEAVVNFPEDEVDAAGRKEILSRIKTEQAKVKELLLSAEHGKILKEGIKIVLCGKPNVGKSSLLNVLLKTPRAIVTDVAGTTRDTIEETASIGGIPFQLVDTAGILEPRDLVEKEAIKRSHIYIESADLILFIIDTSRAVSKEDKDLMAKIKDKNVLVIMNKTDLPQKIDKKMTKILNGKTVVRVSALKKKGIDELEEAIVENVWHGKVVETPKVLISNIRHIEALKDSSAALEKAVDLFKKDCPYELISEEIKTAVNGLDNITGKNINADLLDKIFSEFCIGK